MITGLIIGLLFGVFAGVAVMCLLIAGDDDR